MIEIRNLVKRYGDHVAVDHLNLALEEGKVYGFLGPNGAGKSTTMNIMTGYLSATEGDVVVNGHSILDEPEEAKACIGYLPELPPLYQDMTVTEYLAFCAELKRVPPEERTAQLQKVVHMSPAGGGGGTAHRQPLQGLPPAGGAGPGYLGFPPILILDEPTVGLDPKQVIEIRGLISTWPGSTRWCSAPIFCRRSRRCVTRSSSSTTASCWPTIPRTGWRSLWAAASCT